MLPGTATLNSEEFIFYLDLVGNFLRKKTLTKSINSFIKEKEKFNTLTSYGIVLFQKDDNPINVYNLKDADTVIERVDDAWETRDDKKSYLENGLYEILAYIFRKSRETRKNYRVIIISDTPSKLSDDYYNALYDLLIKARKFSTFIDIIRVGDEKFYEDDVKLKVISSETHGGTFYCPNEKLFSNILSSLIQNKKEFKIIKADDTEQVLKEDKIFYERLAVDLISLSPDDKEICDICEQELCPICEAHSDEIHKCFNCNTTYHNCCAAKYSLAKNIGFNHIFNCLNCQTLIKLDEEFVNMIYQEDLEEELSDGEIKELATELPLTETAVEENYIEESEENEDQIEAKIKPPPLPEIKKVRVGGFFGKEITIQTKNNNREESLETLESVKQIEKPISITTLKPPKKRGTTKIKLCRICGATIQNTPNCPTCGAKID
jgi:hypothetical protein